MKLNKIAGLCSALALSLSLCGCSCDAPVSSKYTGLTPDAAIELLKKGNEAYLSSDCDKDLREDLYSNGQHPYAVVITCSDSRAIPEKAFNANFGDIFTIRTAGNVVSDFEIGSVEYGVEHLGSAVVVVLGHSNCGAVTAALEPADPNAPENHISSIVKEIQPSVELARKDASDSAEVLSSAIGHNVDHSIAVLKQSHVLSELEKEGKLKIIGAVYDIETGKVSFKD